LCPNYDFILFVLKIAYMPSTNPMIKNHGERTTTLSIKLLFKSGFWRGYAGAGLVG